MPGIRFVGSIEIVTSCGVLPLVTSDFSQRPPVCVVVPTLNTVDPALLVTASFCAVGTEPPIWKAKFNAPLGVTVMVCAAITFRVTL
jgi:hypothetical protein